ncbi:MAG: HYR domain-containing protein [Flavobacteriales bacterium]|nr:HYR domain-containing protein [Flavobacteriales bacterium]
MRTSLRPWRIAAVLLTLAAALSPGLHAQVNYTQDFNGCNAATCNNWTISQGFQENITSTSGTGYSPCANASAKSNIYGSETDTYLASNTSLGTSNGSLVTVTFSYKCLDYGTGAATLAGYCRFRVQWSTNGSSWTNVGALINNVSSGSCTTSPARTFTPANGSPVYIRIWAHRNNGDFWAVMDNISVTQAGGPAYCTTGLYSGGSGQNCSDGDDIDDISFANVSQTGTGCTGGTGIANYTGTTANVSQGAVVPFTITTNFSGLHGVAWYIDGNDDGDFADANEYIGSASASGLTITGSFTVPVSVPVGNHRLRVRLQYGSTPTSTQSCTLFTYGETHDYTANVSAGGCTNTSSYPSAFNAPAPLAPAYTISTCQYQSEYNTMNNVTAGHSFTSTASIAGTYITVRSGTYNGPVVAMGTTPLAWTATTSGTHFIHYNTNSSCGTAFTCMTTTVQNTTTNDLCANAIAIASLPYTSGAVSNATATDDVPASACAGPYKNLWWTVTGVCGTMTASTCGSSFDTEIAVFTGSCGSFTEVGCNDDNGPACGGLQGSVSWTGTAGTTYYISVGSYGSSSPTGNITLSVTGADVTVPTITCPGTQSACNTMPDLTALATVSDNCTPPGSITVTQSPAPGSALALGTTLVTLTAMDQAGNSAQCSFNVEQLDTDGDLTADCNDGCPSDPNKTAPGQCGCGVPDTDTDGDLTADCNDLCPTDPNKTAPGQCGCGVADTDTDGDLTADCNDLCPTDPNKIAPGICGCGVADTDTDGDLTADCNDLCPTDPNKIDPGQCGCGVPDTDTDGDLTADCEDGCPNDPNKTWEGVCGCGNPDVDGDGDTVMDCLDGCPTDPNKFEPGVCGCGVPDTDTDGDSVLDCNDLCPLDPLKTAPGSCGCGHAEPGTACDDGDPNTGNDTVNANCQCLGQPLDCAGTPGGPALPGTPCDDLDPGTANDVYDANCTCAGTPTSQSVALVLDTDDDGDQTSWEIIPQGGGTPLCSGANYPNNSTVTLSCPLADGCYELRVMDSFGDGMTIGGYLLRDAQNQRIIDNTGNGDFGTLSQIANNGGFCLPLGTDHVRPSRCDLENLLPTDWTAAQENPAVSAQFGQGNQSDDGYQFWFFDPNGTYSRRILVTHANSDPTFPYGPARCSHLRFTSMVTSPLPHNTLLNVRVRARVNGSYAPFGPACRLRIDPVAQCPTTQLVDDINSPLHSCGITNVLLDGSQYLHAQYVGNAVTYQWEFDDINSAYLRRIAAGSSALHLSAWATLPLQYNTSYSVRVRVSYDGGANWCPWGAACTITTAPLPPGQGQGRGLQALPADEPATFQLWPNPNRGDRVNVLADGLPLEAGSAELALVDLAGRIVIAQQVPVTDGTVQYVLDLQGRAVPGLYTVVLRTQDSERALRLVVQ